MDYWYFCIILFDMELFTYPSGARYTGLIP